MFYTQGEDAPNFPASDAGLVRRPRGRRKSPPPQWLEDDRITRYGQTGSSMVRFAISRLQSLLCGGSQALELPATGSPQLLMNKQNIKSMPTTPTSLGRPSEVGRKRWAPKMRLRSLRGEHSSPPSPRGLPTTEPQPGLLPDWSHSKQVTISTWPELME